jgi:hypothetical protein
MRRWLSIAAIGVAFLAMPGWAQRHGASFSMAGRPGFGARGPGMIQRGPVSAGYPGGIRFGNTFRRPFGFRNQFSHRGFFRGYPWWFRGYGVAYYAYPGYYVDPYLDYGYSSSSYRDYNASASFEASAVQQAEIDRLEDEVAHLRVEQNTREPVPAIPQPVPTQTAPQPQPQTATVLVFRDQHTREVQNYAIVGQTIWVFSEQRATKIPLASLDVPATAKANEERGIDFRLPE